MNYYEHHIGDYDEATAHLTACEDGIYCRLIRKYMAKEQPFPDDLPALQRLVRARTREEKNAVASILTEFFYLLDGFWRQKTCDEVIAKYQAGEPERAIKKSNESNRLKRHREERSALFRVLTEAGEHAPWNIGMAELRALVTRVTGDPAMASETMHKPLPATAPATPATATQTPNTKHQSKPKTEGNSPPGAAPPARACVRPAELSAAMRRHGIEAQPGDPRIIAAAERGMPVATVEAACLEAKLAKPGERISAGYVLAVADRWEREAAAAPAANGRAPPATRSYHDERAETIAALTGRSRDHERDDRTVDVPATRID